MPSQTRPPTQNDRLMSKISLPDFFKYFDATNANQLEAVVLLESMMPDSLLRDKSVWVQKYRSPCQSH